MAEYELIKARTMAIDQYGRTYHNLGKYPRKALLEYFDRKHAERIYVDKTNGQTVHTGWIIANHWLTIYTTNRMENTC